MDSKSFTRNYLVKRHKSADLKDVLARNNAMDILSDTEPDDDNDQAFGSIKEQKSSSSPSSASSTLKEPSLAEAAAPNIKPSESSMTSKDDQSPTSKLSHLVRSSKDSKSSSSGGTGKPSRSVSPNPLHTPLTRCFKSVHISLASFTKSIPNLGLKSGSTGKTSPQPGRDAGDSGGLPIVASSKSLSKTNVDLPVVITRDSSAGSKARPQSVPETSALLVQQTPVVSLPKTSPPAEKPPPRPEATGATAEAQQETQSEVQTLLSETQPTQTEPPMDTNPTPATQATPETQPDLPETQPTLETQQNLQDSQLTQAEKPPILFETQSTQPDTPPSLTETHRSLQDTQANPQGKQPILPETQSNLTKTPSTQQETLPNLLERQPTTPETEASPLIAQTTSTETSSQILNAQDTGLLSKMPLQNLLESEPPNLSGIEQTILAESKEQRLGVETKPTLLETQNPTLTEAQNPTLPETQKPTLPEAQNPTLPETQKPTLPETQTLTLTETKHPTLPETQKPTLPETKKALLPETQKPVLPETKKPTLPETQTPALPETQKPTLPETQKPTLPETQKPTLPETQKPTLPETQKPTLPQTQKPALPETQKPTQPETQKTTLPKSEKPTLPETQKPTLPETQKLTQPETQKTTLQETKEPTLPETQKPTLPKSEKPTLPEIQKLVLPETQKPTLTETQKPTLPETQSPTLPQTQKPALPETQKPTLTETQKPTLTETQNPNLPETQKPTLPKSEKPTLPETQKPALPETQKPTLPQTQKPTLPETQNPTLPQTQKPTLPETPSPTLPETQKPTLPETQSPTLPEIQKPTLPETQSPTLPEIQTANLPETQKPSNIPRQAAVRQRSMDSVETLDKIYQSLKTLKSMTEGTAAALKEQKAESSTDLPPSSDQPAESQTNPLTTSDSQLELPKHEQPPAAGDVDLEEQLTISAILDGDSSDCPDIPPDYLLEPPDEDSDILIQAPDAFSSSDASSVLSPLWTTETETTASETETGESSWSSDQILERLHEDNLRLQSLQGKPDTGIPAVSAYQVANGNMPTEAVDGVYGSELLMEVSDGGMERVLMGGGEQINVSRSDREELMLEGQGAGILPEYTSESAKSSTCSVIHLRQGASPPADINQSVKETSSGNTIFNSESTGNVKTAQQDSASDTVQDGTELTPYTAEHVPHTGNDRKPLDMEGGHFENRFATTYKATECTHITLVRDTPKTQGIVDLSSDSNTDTSDSSDTGPEPRLTKSADDIFDMPDYFDSKPVSKDRLKVIFDIPDDGPKSSTLDSKEEASNARGQLHKDPVEGNVVKDPEPDNSVTCPGLNINEEAQSELAPGTSSQETGNASVNMLNDGILTNDQTPNPPPSTQETSKDCQDIVRNTSALSEGLDETLSGDQAVTGGATSSTSGDFRPPVAALGYGRLAASVNPVTDLTGHSTVGTEHDVCVEKYPALVAESATCYRADHAIDVTNSGSVPECPEVSEISLSRGQPHAPDHQASDHQRTDHQATDHKAANHQAPDHQDIDHQATDHETASHQGPDHQEPNHQASDHQATDHQGTNHQATGDEGPDHQGNDHQATDHQDIDHQVSDHQETDLKAPYHQATGYQATYHQAIDHQAPVHQVNHQITCCQAKDHQATDHSANNHHAPDHQATGHQATEEERGHAANAADDLNDGDRESFGSTTSFGGAPGPGGTSQGQAPVDRDRLPGKKVNHHAKHEHNTQPVTIPVTSANGTAHNNLPCSLPTSTDGLLEQRMESDALRTEVSALRKELTKCRDVIKKMQDKETVLKDRLSEQAMKQLEKGSTKFEDLSLGDNRPTQLIRRYGNLYSETRLDAFDALEELPEIAEFDDLKGKLLFSVVVLAFRAVQRSLQETRTKVRHLLCMPAPDARTTFAREPIVRELEDTISVYLRKFVDKYDSSKNVETPLHELTEEVCSQVWSTLYDYPSLRKCSGLRQYITECVRLAWALSVQNPPLVIEYDSKIYSEDWHTRFHTSDPDSQTIRSVLWPTLREGEHGSCVYRGVVIT